MALLSWMNKINNFLNRIEKGNISLGLWLGAVFSLSIIRYFLENVLSFSPNSNFIATFIKVPLFFVDVLLAFNILIHLFSRVEIAKVSKVTLIFLSIIFLPLIVDLGISRLSGENILYRYLSLEDNLVYNFLNFFNPFTRTDFPYGLRVEVALMSLLVFLYIFLKRRNILLSLMGSLSAFIVVFSLLATPGILFNFSKFLNFIFLSKPDGQL
ncbi:MAG: hypothetical protein Q8N14_06895, partial [Candidatus Omnitrophota bacterium]|nr:hypothetical protein [Candidatus Omnitrophota bacterium]